MIFRELFWFVVIYLLYRFVFELLIPVIKTVIKMKATVSKMQEQQEQFKQAPKTDGQQPHKTSTTNINDEYIDFEEIK